jgi:ferredoxin
LSHHKLTKGGLEEVGRLQIPLTSFYVRIEPTVIRMLDRTVRLLLRLRGRPVLKVLSRLLSFLPTAEVITVDQAIDFIDAIAGHDGAEITVGPCMCQKALGRRTGTYMKDMFILYGAEAYKRADSDHRDLSPEEAKSLLRELHGEGLVPAFYACMRSRGWAYVLCSCEKEICFPFRAHLAAGGVLSPGMYTVVLDTDRCTGCGVCVDRCHFGANSLVDGLSTVDLSNCYGCGVCVSTCAGDARTMVNREGYRNRYYPLDLVGETSAI